ncbi:alpha-L-fucosidase [Tessaracoccus terricola]
MKALSAEAMLNLDADRWSALKRPTPEWFRKSRLGYFVHWGAYSVPAWAEPVAELGTIPARQWYRHNPYSEWYMNTIRLHGSPAQRHHSQSFGGDYDDFIDMWRAELFDGDSLAKELAAGGGSYVVLTTKHHDGVCLWDAPGTGERNTVRRGPRRDLVQEFAAGVRRAGMRFGAYYSGGLDWNKRPTAPIGLRDELRITERPKDLGYARYAARHVRDLVHRYRPDILWNDIDWPDAGKNFGPYGIGTIFEEYYALKPDGVVNDRWQVPHSDYLTSEYQHDLSNEGSQPWENCRGLGLSFAFNQAENAEHALSSVEAIKHLIDVTLRGGRLLLGVGPTAAGTLPAWQSQIVARIGDWLKPLGHLLERLEPTSGPSPDPPWQRRGSIDGQEFLFIDSDDVVDVPGAELITPQWASMDGTSLRLSPTRPGPAVVRGC